MRKLVLILTLVAFVAIGCQAMTGKTAKETANDAYIVSAINGKILADPDLKFLQINVDSYEGKVTLTGRVPSNQARTKLIDMARSTKGVQSVTPNLTVATAEAAKPSASAPAGSAPSASASAPVTR